MPTLAERTKLLSGLYSGTLAQHLAAIVVGTGYVFASRFSVSIEDPQITLIQRANKSSAQVVEDDQPVQSPGTKKNVFVRTSEARIVVQTAIDEVVITSRKDPSITTKTYPQHVAVSRKRSVAQF